MAQRPLVDEIQNYAQNIFDTVREPLLILDATFSGPAKVIRHRAPILSAATCGDELRTQN
jgi:hypothetical protein